MQLSTPPPCSPSQEKNRRGCLHCEVAHLVEQSPLPAPAAAAAVSLPVLSLAAAAAAAAPGSWPAALHGC
eukprot:84677-Pelagomonas_calceolata.AAC.1